MWRAKPLRSIWQFLGLTLLACSISLSQGSDPVQLDQGNFTTFIDGQDPSHGVLMEFYANW